MQDVGAVGLLDVIKWSKCVVDTKDSMISLHQSCLSYGACSDFCALYYLYVIRWVINRLVGHISLFFFFFKSVSRSSCKQRPPDGWVLSGIIVICRRFALSGVRNMAKAYANSPSDRRKECLVNVKCGFKECTQVRGKTKKMSKHLWGGDGGRVRLASACMLDGDCEGLGSPLVRKGSSISLLSMSHVLFR